MQNMFSPYHTAGFYYTPVCKALLSTLVLLSVAFNVPLSAYRRWFSVNYSSIFEQLQLLACSYPFSFSYMQALDRSSFYWVQRACIKLEKLLFSRVLFLDPKDVICGCILIYHFRIFERRFGSTKFMSYILGCWCLSILLELCVLFLFHTLDIRLHSMPTGPWGAVFAMYVPYFIDIPRVAVTHVWGIPVTGKSLTYIIGLQMMSSSLECVLLAVCGLLSGLIYKHDMLLIQSWLKVPRYVGQLSHLTLGHLFSTPPPRDLNTPMGATLELQRLTRIEQLEQQQTMWAQQNIYNNHNQMRGFGLFRRPAAVPTDEEIENSARSLIDMGFPRDRAVAALRRSQNNVEMATNLLLAQAVQ